MKIYSLLVAAILWGADTELHAQLTIETCQQQAQQNYPLVMQYNLIREAQEYDLNRASKGYLPQLSLAAKATYQTDVTQIPFSLPNMNIPSPSKDQYQVVAEVNQVLWDGGHIRAQKQQIKASAEKDLQEQQVSMYAIRERVNALFFGILLLEERLNLNSLYEQELARTYAKINSFIDNGIANSTDLATVRVAQLANHQQRAELESANQAYRQMLGAFIGTSAVTDKLIHPVTPEETSMEINRPELQLFTARNSVLDAQVKQLNARTLPSLHLFVQGAYGRPGLNMLQNDFKVYAIGGIRFSWAFGNYYTRQDDLRQIEVARRTIRTQQETFLFNTHRQIESGHGEIEKYRRTMTDDQEIITLREKIQRSCEAKVSEGTMSVIDYMQEVTQTETARQNEVLHRIQLIQAIYNLKNITNN